MTLALATLVVLNASSFTELSARLKPVPLPLSDLKSLDSVPLGAEDAVTWVIAPVAKSGVKGSLIPALWAKERQAETRALLSGKSPGDEASVNAVRVAAHGVVARKGHALLIASVSIEANMYTTTDTFFLVYSADGSLLGSTLFAQDLQGEGGAFSMAGTLSTDGAISRSSRSVYPLMDGPQVEETELAVTSEQPGKWLATGRFEEGASIFRGLEGRFIDKSSKEELMVFSGPRVFYRASEKKPWQALVVPSGEKGPTIGVRFDKSPKVYKLTWSQTGSLSCLNPDGKTQTFTRSW